MTDGATILGLAARVDGLSGPDRALDGEIAEQVYGWKPFKVGPDYDGQNACEVLTPDGRHIQGFAYPPRGFIPRHYHVPQYTRDPTDSAVPKGYIRAQLAAELRARASS